MNLKRAESQAGVRSIDSIPRISTSAGDGFAGVKDINITNVSFRKTDKQFIISGDVNILIKNNSSIPRVNVSLSDVNIKSGELELVNDEGEKVGLLAPGGEKEVIFTFRVMRSTDETFIFLMVMGSRACAANSVDISASGSIESIIEKSEFNKSGKVDASTDNCSAVENSGRTPQTSTGADIIF